MDLDHPNEGVVVGPPPPPPKGHVKQRASARGLLLVSLSRFFANPSNMRAVLPYINGESMVSLRLIDWFVTNFSKKHNVFISRSTGVDTQHVNVYQSYRVQLKAYSKQQFDPFRRRDRIVFCYEDDHRHHGSIETTVGQLNFFRWMLENGILDYVKAHAEEIEADMITWQQHRCESADATHATHATDAADATDVADAASSEDEECDEEGEGRGCEGKEDARDREDDREMVDADFDDGDVATKAGDILPPPPPPPRSQRRSRSELSTSAPTMAMMRMGGTRVLAFE